MPDSSLLHVGTRTPDTSPTPSSLLDDAGGRPHPSDGPSSRGDDTPTTPTDPPSTAAAHGGDELVPGPSSDGPGPHDPASPPAHGDDGTPGGGPGVDAKPLSQSDFAQLSASEQMALAKAELARGAVDFDSEAAAIKYGQDRWNGYADDLPAEQAAAVRDYTGAAYTEYNGALRGEKPMTPELQSQIAQIDKALAGHPVPEDLIVSRGSGFAHLTDDPTTLIGQVIGDDGFLSTSLGSAAFSHKPAIFHFFVPEGTPGMYVGKVSQLANAEKELLLGRGLEFEVQRVFLDDKGKWQIFATILKADS